MSEIEWNIIKGLRDGYNVLAQGMRDASLIHDVRVLASEIDNHHLSSKNQIEDVLDDRALLPDVVGSEAPKACRLARPGNRSVTGENSARYGIMSAAKSSSSETSGTEKTFGANVIRRSAGFAEIVLRFSGEASSERNFRESETPWGPSRQSVEAHQGRFRCNLRRPSSDCEGAADSYRSFANDL